MRGAVVTPMIMEIDTDFLGLFQIPDITRHAERNQTLRD